MKSLLTRRSTSIYVAEHQYTALAEVDHSITSSLRKSGRITPSPPLTIYAIHVKLNRVLDLADKAVVDALGTNFAELKEAWAQQMKNGDPVPTHILAEAVYDSHRYQAIRFLSVEHKGGINLVVWTRKIRKPCFVEVYDPSSRLAARIPKS